MNAFYLQANDWPTKATNIELKGQESQHLAHVLRMKEGEQVLVYDGHGRSGIFSIETVSRNKSKLCLIEEKIYAIPKSRISLALGWGKAARRGFILEKAVELEAHSLIFWQAEHSQFPLPTDIKETWQKQLIVGLKQCKNPFLPILKIMPNGVHELLEYAKDFDHKHLLIESSFEHQSFMDSSFLAQEGDTLCVIGPEGGFSKKEVELFSDAGFICLSMGDRILRWETAAIMALGLHWWKKGNPE